ncbi:GGDEF domain-containing protein [Filibacter tadaridae]|uniref:Putative diguanylate cyclase YcdT n=1 Tax=Filibacter tadaridae TaxID=2483811 RepID=A0A3P5XU24_9BACL|nr:GGDEF domain-containing protein [Filibacter tadaridae]VDC32633.1 putative diguanylate cyclase YcdT [Filibacter tadaridae]
MLNSKKQRISIFFAWLLIVPLGVYNAYSYSPSLPIDWENVIFLFAILFITMFLPFKFQNVMISLERWITFTIFFQYGLFTELIFTQLAMFLLLFGSKTDTPALHRFFINSLIFTLVSFISGYIFHYMGGVIGSLDFFHISLFGLLYAVSYTVLNSIIMQLYLYFEFGVFTFWEKHIAWDFLVTMLLLPFAIALYFLYEHLGNKAIILTGIPFLIILLIGKMYNQSDNLNGKLSSASSVGRKLADQLRVDDVIKTFIEKLKDVVSYENAYVLDLRSGEHLYLLMSSENGLISQNASCIDFKSLKEENDGLSLDVTTILRSKKELRSLKNFQFLDSVKCVMTAPIRRNQKTEGFLILTSNKKNVFQSLERKIVDILTGYFAISLVKASYYEKTIENSERCGLTHLYNYRYLDATLDEEMIRLHTREIASLSVIMMDIDHFKSINDTYGHQSGNDLLVALARLLEKVVPEKATLARYGGEEFVIALPDIEKEAAIELAEQIRHEVDQSLFTIVPDLSEEREPVDVHMTVSIGVASVPEDADDAKALIRNADRALYIGGKQAGRNRVGVYGGDKSIHV